MQNQELIYADTFFLISSIGFIVVAIVLVIGLIYMISILRSVRRITEKIEAGIETVGEDAKELIGDLRESTAFRMIFGGRFRRKQRPVTKK